MSLFVVPIWTFIAAVAIVVGLILARRLTLEPTEIEKHARQFRAKAKSFRRRSWSKGERFLVIGAVLLFIFIKDIREVMIAVIAVYAIAVLVRILTGIGACSTDVNPPSSPEFPDVVPPEAPLRSIPQAPAVKRNYGAGPRGEVPGPAPSPIPRPEPQPRRFEPRPPALVLESQPARRGGFAALGLVGLIIGGAALMFVSTSEVSMRFDGDGDFASVRGEGERLSQSAIPARFKREISVSVNKQERRIDRSLNKRSEPAVRIMPTDDPTKFFVPRGADQRVELVTNPYATGDEAEPELLAKLTAIVPEAMRQRLGDAASEVRDWQPPARLLARDLMEHYETIDEPAANGSTKQRVKIWIDTSEQKLRRVLDRFKSDRSNDRSVRLGKAYAGTVLVLGGLAIFLRLGTGRKQQAT